MSQTFGDSMMLVADQDALRHATQGHPRDSGRRTMVDLLGQFGRLRTVAVLDVDLEGIRVAVEEAEGPLWVGESYDVNQVSGARRPTDRSRRRARVRHVDVVRANGRRTYRVDLSFAPPDVAQVS